MCFSSRFLSWLAPRGPRHLSTPPGAVRRVHPHVRHIVARLSDAGYYTVIAGGAVRDLLGGVTPRDFDLATAASPEQVHRLFDNARIIGRRFRLVHITYPELTVEVSTFRSSSRHLRKGMIVRDNSYGNPREDAFRRDFTINALLYELDEDRIVDHVGGIADLQQGLLRTISAAAVSLREDPVRMLRMVRFKVRLGFTVVSELEQAIKAQAESLGQVKRHRLAEETQRFLTRGGATAIFAELDHYGLLGPMLGLKTQPWFFNPKALEQPLSFLQPYLNGIQRWLNTRHPPPSATVALLGLVLSLAAPEMRGTLLGLATPRSKGMSSTQLFSRLEKMLGTWGLLNGQVAPALRILTALRTLLKIVRKDAFPPAMAGLREAWQLVALLAELPDLPSISPEQAAEQMQPLPPIFVHQPRRPFHRQQRTQQGAVGSGADNAEQSAPRKRRSYRRRSSKRQHPL